jgi:hypothetical protein
MANPNSGRTLQAWARNQQTAASGTGWAPLADDYCDAVDIVNDTGQAIEFQRTSNSASALGIPIPTGQSYWVTGIKNASDLSVRRVDQSVTQVTVKYECHRLP